MCFIFHSFLLIYSEAAIPAVTLLVGANLLDGNHDVNKFCSFLGSFSNSSEEMSKNLLTHILNLLQVLTDQACDFLSLLGSLSLNTLSYQSLV